MIKQSFDKVSKDDVDRLISEKAVEHKTLEYKERLPGDQPEAKKEFLADVSSFANASGGDILLGIIDQKDGNGRPTGIPEKAVGLVGVEGNAAIARLENLIRDGIDPTLGGVQIKRIEGFESGPVVLIRVPRSWMSPHMVTLGGHFKFYSRTAAGKHPLDVDELRSAFGLAESLVEHVRGFRADRLAKITANETPVPIGDSARIVLHLVPFAAFEGLSRIDVTIAAGRLPPNVLHPISGSSFSHRFNLDGFLTYSSSDCGYVQVFRSGAIEATDTRQLEPYGAQGGVVKAIATIPFERKLISVLEMLLNVEKQLGLTGPFFLMVSVLGVRGYGLANQYGGADGQIDRDDLVLSDVLIEDGDAADVVLRSTFDSIWQAIGFERSQNYASDGRWIHRPRQ